MRPRHVVVLTAFTAALSLPAAPALAFHHIVLPAPDCAAMPAVDHAGGITPVVGAHNPVQELPLPPAGTPAEATLAAQNPCAEDVG
jgi:hypothetical protein